MRMGGRTRMRNPTSDCLRFVGPRHIRANIVVWALLVPCAVLSFAATGHAQINTDNATADAAELARVPVDVNALVASDPVAIGAVDSNPPDVNVTYPSIVATVPSDLRNKLPTYFP